MVRKSMTAGIAAGVALLLLAGCGGHKDSFKPVSIEVDRPYIYPEAAPAKGATDPKATQDSKDSKDAKTTRKPKGSGTAFGLMRIRNKGGTADRLLRVSAHKSGPVQMQRTLVVDGNPIQRTVQSIDIPAGGSVEMKTSGYFLRFERVGETFKDGGTFPVVLEFMVAGKLPVEFATKTSGPALPKPAPKDADGNPLATGGPISIEGLEAGKYGTEATGPAPKAGAAKAGQPGSGAAAPSTSSGSAGSATAAPASNLSKPSS